LLEARQRLGVGIDAFVVQLPQPLDDLVELLRVDLLLTEQTAQLLGIGRASPIEPPNGFIIALCESPCPLGEPCPR
jgi:hypothetical protein